MTNDKPVITPEIDCAVQSSKRMIEITRELEQLREKETALQDELFIVSEQYKCFPHDWVEKPSYIINVDVCTKCGYEFVY